MSHSQAAASAISSRLDANNSGESLPPLNFLEAVVQDLENRSIAFDRFSSPSRIEQWRQACANSIAGLSSCLSHLQLRERRRANQLVEGGVQLSDSSKQYLENLAGLAIRIAKVIDVAQQTAQASGEEESVCDLFCELLRRTLLVTQLSSQLLNIQKYFEVTVQSLVLHYLQSVDRGLFTHVDCYLVSTDDLPTMILDEEAIQSVVDLISVEDEDFSDSNSGNEEAISSESDSWHLRLKLGSSKGRNKSKNDNYSHPGAKNKRLRRSLSNSDSFAANSVATQRRQSNGGLKSAAKAVAVTETKLVLLFEVTFKFRGDTFKFRLNSNPVIRTSHAKQYMNSWLTLFWDNAFSTETVPSEVSREDFVTRLLDWFGGRAFNAFDHNQVTFLLECLPARVTKSELLSGKTNDRLPLRLPFWRWFYLSTMLILKNAQVRTFWENGWIAFISQSMATRILRDSQVNSSIIRFSTATTEGALSILFYQRNEAMDERVLCKYGVWSQDDFEKRSFFGSLFDCNVEMVVNVARKECFQWRNYINQQDFDAMREAEDDQDDSDDDDDAGLVFVRTQLRRSIVGSVFINNDLADIPIEDLVPAVP